MLRYVSRMQAICLFLSLWLTVGSAAYFVPRTPRGVHCPTAAVQAVAEVVTHAGADGKTTTEVVYRKPVEGEKEFKQCHCAEKKSEQQQPATQARTYEAPIFALTASKPVPLVAAFIPASLGLFAAIKPRNADWQAAPPVPPPNFS